MSGVHRALIAWPCCTDIFLRTPKVSGRIGPWPLPNSRLSWICCTANGLWIKPLLRSGPAG